MINIELLKLAFEAGREINTRKMSNTPIQEWDSFEQWYNLRMKHEEKHACKDCGGYAGACNCPPTEYKPGITDEEYMRIRKFL